jgi:hypothetical protein
MSTPLPASTKTVIEVTPDNHQRLREGAAKTGNSMKRFSSLILEYALSKFENGEIGLREPIIEDVEPQDAPEA